MKVKLSDILVGMESQSDESEAWLNVKTGEVIRLGQEEIDAGEDGDDPADYPEWQQPLIEAARAIYCDESPDYIQLPDRFEIDEYRMMDEFIDTVENEDYQRQLARSIQGGGAFRRFKDVAGDLGLLETWYAYRGEAYKRTAKEWCEANGIDYSDKD